MKFDSRTKIGSLIPLGNPNEVLYIDTNGKLAGGSALTHNGNSNLLLETVGESATIRASTDTGSAVLKLRVDKGTASANVWQFQVVGTSHTFSFVEDDTYTPFLIQTTTPTDTFVLSPTAIEFNMGLNDIDTIFYGATNEVMRVDALNERVGIGTSTPDTILHIAHVTSPKITFEDINNVSTFTFGGQSGIFSIVDETNSDNRLLFVPTGATIINNGNGDLDTIINDDTAELARFNAGTHNLEFQDDKYITLGTTLDALFGYDSANAQALLDLTGVANTSYKIKTTGNANSLTIRGSDGRIAINAGAWVGADIYAVTGASARGFAIEHVSLINDGASVPMDFSLGNTISAATTGSFETYGIRGIVVNKFNAGGTTADAGLIVGNLGKVEFNSTSGTSNMTTMVSGYESRVRFGGSGDHVYNFNDIVSGFKSSGIDSHTDSSVVTVADYRHFNTVPHVNDANLTVTKNTGYYVQNLGNARVVTNYGQFIEEQTGSTNDYEQWFAGGGEAFFRQSDIHIGSLAADHLDLTAPFIDLNGITLATDKIAFTQTDLNEYIDSPTDGVLDVAATVGVRILSPILSLTQQATLLSLKDNEANSLAIYEGVNPYMVFDTTNSAEQIEVYKTTILNSTTQLQFGDTGTYINQGADTFLDLVADGAVRVTSTLEVNAKSKITAIGGFAVKLTNKTGSNTVAGQIIKASTVNDDAVVLTDVDGDECFGVFLDAGVADGSEAWVVVSGIADVAMEDNTAATRGNWVAVSGEAGYADATNAHPVAAPTHFRELGHCIESVAAGGAGTHILARCIIHFN